MLPDVKLSVMRRLLPAFWSQLQLLIWEFCAWLVVSFPGFHVLNSSMSPGSGRHVLGASPLNWIYELSDDYKLALPVDVNTADGHLSQPTE